MDGEKNLKKLLKALCPRLNRGEFVFCVIKDLAKLDHQEILFTFREAEAITVVLKKEAADLYGLDYNYIASWITLTVNSSLEAVGLTAAFSTALANAGISCNVVAAFYHDHIFVNEKDAERAIKVLEDLSLRQN